MIHASKAALGLILSAFAAMAVAAPLPRSARSRNASAM